MVAIPPNEAVQQHHGKHRPAIVRQHANESAGCDRCAQDTAAGQHRACVVEVVAHEECPVDQVEAEQQDGRADELQVGPADQDHVEEVQRREDGDVHQEDVHEQLPFGQNQHNKVEHPRLNHFVDEGLHIQKKREGGGQGMSTRCLRLSFRCTITLCGSTTRNSFARIRAVPQVFLFSAAAQ
uniref:(northern house mosquito) hypothetical protein n=1 Tax=Culex pipiens TaxID=7175 RepID=A0A8D8HYY9_CULPI